LLSYKHVLRIFLVHLNISRAETRIPDEKRVWRAGPFKGIIIIWGLKILNIISQPAKGGIMGKRKTVIIGGVAGGASCAARLRRLDADRDIIILERGEYISYANCGLPYHVGDVIKNRSALLLMTPEILWNRFRIEVRTKNEVISINREKKTVTVRKIGNEETGNSTCEETYEESYDDLVIATGSSPIRPAIEGIDNKKIKTLWTVPDTDGIKSMIQNEGVKTAAVIGAGFIGLEMVENLKNTGIEVSLIEALDQVMAPMDHEMAALLHGEICKNGVKLYLNNAVEKFEDKDEKVIVHLKSGETIAVDMVILSIGVRPNSDLAKGAGLDLNERGGIITDDHMRTKDPSIYAVGDVIEVEDFIFKDRTMIPLAGPANKQGRILADVLSGRDSVYRATQGSSVAKVFSLTAASTGVNEKTLKKRGMQKGRDYESLIIIQNSHAAYYPGATPMTIKLLFACDTEKIFGAQIIGTDGVDKRIDTIGVALRLGAKVTDLKDLEFAYAPPYSAAKDPVNMAGFVAENILTGLVKISSYDVTLTDKDALLLDVREVGEVRAYSIPNAINIPLGSLRDRINELDRQKRIIIFCGIGVRAYTASRILSQAGFEKVEIYPGGVKLYSSIFRTQPQECASTSQPQSGTGEAKPSSMDCCGSPVNLK